MDGGVPLEMAIILIKPSRAGVSNLGHFAILADLVGKRQDAS
jgi:hypothetical protein